MLIADDIHLMISLYVKVIKPLLKTVYALLLTAMQNHLLCLKY